MSRALLEGPLEVPKKRIHVQRLLKDLSADSALCGAARALDSGEALAERMQRSGVTDIGLPNLSNQDIVSLRPTYAHILETVVTYKEKHWKHEENPTKAFIEHILGVGDADVRFELKDGFIVLFKQIGLTWIRS